MRAGGSPSWRSAFPGPLSLERVVVYVLLIALGFTVTAALLMLAGFFRPLPVALGTALVGGVLVRRWVKAVPQEDPRRRLAGRSASLRVVLAALIAASAVSGVVFSSEHVETDRDPGVYVNAGRWLADHGTLLVDPAVEGFEGADPAAPDDEQTVFFPSGGYYTSGHRFGLPQDHLFPRFFHALSAYLAVGGWIGGDALLVRVNALLGALVLLVMFALGARLMKPWFALAATAALGVNLTQVYFQRDAFSEVLTQLFLFGGLWALWEASRHRTVDRGLIAGLLLGATCFVRVDSFLYLAPLALALGVTLLRTARGRPDRYPGHRRFVLAVALGTGTTAGLGLVQGLLLSPPYVLDVRRSLVAIAGAVLVVALGTAGLIRYGEGLQGFLRPLRRHRRLIALGAVTAVVAGTAIAYGLRPELAREVGRGPNGLVEGLQRREGVEVNGLRTYGELSMRWLGWYLGPIGLVAGVAGWARGWWTALRGRGTRLLPLLFVFTGTTIVYLWRPRITPDHVWAMRRFLPVAIPGLLLLGCWFAAWLWDGWDDPRTLRRLGASIVVAGVLAHSAWTLAPVPTAHGQRGLAAVRELCDTLPEGSGVLVAVDDGFFLRYPQTVRGFCGVPTAFVSPELPPERYRDLARPWEDRGGALFLLSSVPTPEQLEGADPAAEPAASTTYERLERRLLGRPSEMRTVELALYLVRL